MKNVYRLFKRGKVYYSQHNQTGRQQSLETQDSKEAEKILHAMNEAAQNPELNRKMAEVYLSASDEKLATRTWQAAMDELSTHGRESTQARCKREMASKPFTTIRNKVIVLTTSDDFHRVLKAGGSSTNNYLRRLHNLAFGFGWLSRPVIPPKLWPKQRPKPKRGVTREEHEAIIAAEKNLERRQYYEMLWVLGASQTDTANLTAENIDWTRREVVYKRQKLSEDSKPARMSIGATLEKLLRELPSEGPLFPTIRRTTDAARASEFIRRLKTLGITGISLHSYRYAWAERAKTCGYPERYAQTALGHNSRAVHHAYAKGADVICPPMEEWDAKKKIIPLRPSDGELNTGEAVGG